MTDRTIRPALRLQVVYALAQEQHVVQVEVAEGTTVKQAIDAAGIARYTGPDMAGFQVGIYGRRVRLDVPVRDGDRIEIYRPLIADPKESRRARALRTPRRRA